SEVLKFSRWHLNLSSGSQTDTTEEEEEEEAAAAAARHVTVPRVFFDNTPMGPKQSSPSAGVRVRSFSGSDVSSADGRPAVLRYYSGSSTGQIGERLDYSSQGSGSFIQSPVIPSSGRRDAEQAGRRALLIGSLPAQLTPHLLGVGFDCPICSKYVCSEEMDVHLLMCFSKPRLRYNDDVLSRDSGECSICLDEMIEGDAIARLPCLCIYHKGCIDGWFEMWNPCVSEIHGVKTSGAKSNSAFIPKGLVQQCLHGYP
ncbi:hypothetical protein DNTS_021698, partial [Danionella cerebrum]